MPNKTVRFYKISLPDNIGIGGTATTVTLKNLLDNFLTQQSSNGNIRPWSFEYIDNEVITVDPLKNDDDYLLCRIAKKKDSHSIVIRDNSTQEATPVLTDEEKTKQLKTLQECTFFLIDYTTNIVSFLIGSGAPTPKCIEYMVKPFNKDCIFSVTNIAEEKNVQRLMQDGATISRILYTLPVPDATVLKDFGFTESQILEFQHSSTDIFNIDIVLKPKPRGKIAKGQDAICKVVNSLGDGIRGIKPKFFGNEPNVKAQDYEYIEGKLAYSVRIKDSDLERGNIVDVYFTVLRNEYLKHKEKLLYLTAKVV
ncbi:MAG: hypothetical protein FWE11_08330 [Defluviitaleaceae bacterium]|nr:hypothetical protein [Defluviitaleaceae bacterium]